MLIDSRGGPPFGGYKLMNSRGGPPIWGCMLMNSRGGPPHFERGSASRDNVYGSSGISYFQGTKVESKKHRTKLKETLTI